MWLTCILERELGGEIPAARDPDDDLFNDKEEDEDEEEDEEEEEIKEGESVNNNGDYEEISSDIHQKPNGSKNSMMSMKSQSISQKSKK